MHVDAPLNEVKGNRDTELVLQDGKQRDAK